MSTATPELKTSRNPDKYVSNWKLIALPYAIAILAQLPMLLLYFRNLAIEKPHYQTAPIAFIATIVIAYFRWPKEAKMPFHRSVLSDLLLMLGVLFAIICVLCVWPAAGAGSVMLLIASLLARTVDKESLKSLWPASLPMFVFLSLPAGSDVKLITWLQRVSAFCTSRLLDLYGLGHYMNGTVIQVPGKEHYGIEAACSGVQSFFTLMFIAVLFIVVFRRPLFRSILLIISAVFWAVFMNTIRIFLIPALDQLDIDVAHGFPHALLGWGTLAVGVLLLLSTDQFMTFMFGPVDPEIGKSGPFGKLITKAWNGLISGEEQDGEGTKRKKRKVRKPITNAGKFVIWGLCGVLALSGLWSSYDVAYSYTTSSDNVSFFDSKAIKSFEKNDLPEKLDQWTAIENGHAIEIRERGSDIGNRSDQWTYRGSNFTALVSLDQPFPSWHELTSCYQNTGWERLKRERRGDPLEPGAANGKWPYVVSEFKRETGEHAFLVFAIFNAQGEAVIPPAKWDNITSWIFTGIQYRVSNRVRKSLFDSSTYQIQVFVTSYGNGLDDAAKQEIEDHFVKIRDTLRDKFVERSGIAVESTSPPPATVPVAAE